METARPPELFHVIKQEHSQGFRTDGTIGGTWTITAEAHGVTFSVQVPDEGYNAPAIHALLADRAATIGSVNALGTAPE